MEWQRTLTSSTKGVATRKLPHAGENLHDATDKEGHANDDVGNGDSTNARVVEREDQRR